ncbi:hypothetical protein [Nocardioides sp. AE5]|uniref:hypothetical protein n=1 Tax=Nocardioides sp. AE5 TaxID=2962573 RepID=UPI002882428D|nr:hypothetical protein [Nocardioides sp. AE5]MDT0202218.1 hypothetical protein [Nocardioides sp. AE5]
MNVYTVMGGVEVIVNPGTNAVVGGIGIMGAFDGVRNTVPAQSVPGAPVVRIKGFALMGGVGVVRKAMPTGDDPRQLPGSA